MLPLLPIPCFSCSGEAKLKPENALVVDLAAAYANVRAATPEALSRTLQALRDLRTVYVGSGGMSPVAQLAAVLAGESGASAWHRTPLNALELFQHSDACVVFSARAGHPDTAFALSRAASFGLYPRILVTQRDEADLPARISNYVTEVISVPSFGRNGFLATTAVMTMATAVVACYANLPPTLPAFAATDRSVFRSRVLVLAGPGLGPVAADLETRASELGLATVQVTDYRNLAHGRHLGLAAHAASTSLIALVSPGLSDLARRTLELIPSSVEIIRLESDLTDGLGALDLLVRSISLADRTARAAGLNPDKPRVQKFGRRLYHLSAGRQLATGQATDPIERKLRAAGVGDGQAEMYRAAFRSWLRAMRSTTFVGLALDYDGTVTTTNGRFDLPTSPVQEALLRLLEGGALLGFASGRGRSLHADLRKWLPPAWWGQVYLGLYNGGLGLSLADEIPAPNQSDDDVAAFLARMQTDPFASSFIVEVRPRQLTIEPRGSSLSVQKTVEYLLNLADRDRPLKVTVLRSAHSIDVIPSASSKITVIEFLEQAGEGPVLAIGDQGQRGGNDAQFLASRVFSLSVDRCSSDPTRCWNLGRGPEHTGPSLLRDYLEAMQTASKGFRFRWRL